MAGLANGSRIKEIDVFHKLLIAYFGAFLLFWFLGIDQLYFVFICLVGFFAYLFTVSTDQPKSTDEPKPGPEVWFFAFFVFATFFSVFQITTPDRYLTYVRNEGVYISMLFVFVSSTFASARNTNTTDILYFALLLFSIQCSVVAFLASNGFSISFKSVAAYLIPDMNSKYISGMINKNSIQAEASWFSKGFFRPRGLMMYPNTMAGILASTMAIKAYFIYKFWRDQFKVFAILCLLLIFMDVFSIYSSLSRSTWIGLVIALAVFPFAFKTSFIAKLMPIMVGAVIIGLVFLTGLNEGIESRLLDKTHSNEGRGFNYTLIWQETTSSVDKLLFGHGTQIDHWMLNIPLGSHSTYMGVFFKFGVIGAVFFLLFLFFLYRLASRLTANVNTLNSNGCNYIRPYFLCFALITPIVQMMFIEVDVDLSYALYFSAVVFLVRQESRIVNDWLGRLSNSELLDKAHENTVIQSTQLSSKPLINCV